MSGLKGHRGGTVYTMNLDHLRRFVWDPLRASNYNAASIVTADGTPLIWASRLLGTPLPERVTGSSLIWTLTAAAAANDKSIYLLGGAPGTAKKAARVLKQRYPKLKIAGISDETFEVRANEPTYRALRRKLVCAKPDIVYVALGSPKQEDLIERLRPTLPQAWWLGVGIAFSFVAGEISRAPLWMQRSGLEWVHRLVQEPRRLAKRYLIQGLPFAAVLLAHSMYRRLFGNRDTGEPKPAGG
jgi:N-acetylglucosaminyldiphosphoundecaprenol N-acetyl-beta-D-mannosaminyltransferase